MAVLLAVVTFLLVNSSGKEAEEAQRLNKDEAVRMMVLRESRIVDDLTSLYLRTALQAVKVDLTCVRRAMYSASDLYVSIGSYPDIAKTFNEFEERAQIMKVGRIKRRLEKYIPSVQLQILQPNGFYYDDRSVINDPDSFMQNGTQLRLNESDLPSEYGFVLQPAAEESSSNKYFERSVYDPFKRLWWTDLPYEYETIHDMEKHPTRRATPVRTKMYVGEYQVMPICLSDAQQRFNTPFFTETRSMDYLALWTLSFSSRELSYRLRLVIDSDTVRSPLSENMTYVVHTEDGLTIASDEHRVDGWATNYYGATFVGLPQLGFRLFTLFDSPQWELNAYGHHVLSKYGRLSAGRPDGEIIVGSFNSVEHYHGYRTESMWFPFDGSAVDASWNVRDAWTECRGGGTGCYRFDAGVGGPQGPSGQCVYLDGTAAVRISPWLTTREPRVAAMRVPGAVYRSRRDYWNHSAPVDGIPDVLVTQRNPRPSQQGEAWAPVQRELLFYETDYSISAWVKRARPGGKGMVFADSTTPDTNIRVYEDGSVVLQVVSYGCRTAAVGVPVGEWVFLTAVVGRARRRRLGHCAMYVNGVRRTWSPMGTSVSHTRLASNFSIGPGFVGHIDDLRVHNITLSAGQVDALMRKGDARWVPDVDLMYALLTPDPGSDPVPHKDYHIAVIVPHADVVRESRANAAQVTQMIALQDQYTQETMQMKNDSTVLVVAAIILTGICMFVTFNSALARPFVAFATDITQVSQIEVEGINPYPHNASLLREINAMRSAVNVLVTNMKSFKSFMPLSVQAAVQGHSTESASDSASSMRSASSTSHSSTMIHARSASSAGMGNASIKALALSLAERRMGFLVVNIVGFHNAPLREASSVSLHQRYIAVVLQVSAACKGLADNFSGDRAFITFNGAKPNSSFRESCTRAGLSVRATMVPLGLEVSAAVTAGKVLAGYIGAEGMLRYSTLGVCVSWVHVLERYSQRHSIPLMADCSIHEACAASFVFHYLCVVPPSRILPSSRACIVSRVMKSREVTTDEWMYELGEAKKSPFEPWNEILVSVAEQRWDTAKRLLADMDAAGAAYYKVTLTMIETQSHERQEGCSCPACWAHLGATDLPLSNSDL